MREWISRRGRASGPVIAWGAAVGIYVFVSTFPGEFYHVAPGTDSSWIYALNRLPSTDLVFGTDVVFTYGPLGYLLVPANVGTNLVHGAAIRLLSQATLAFLVGWFATAHRRVDGAIGFGLAWIFAGSFAFSYEYQLLLLLGLLLAVPAERTGPWRVASLTASLLGSALLFMRPPLGLAAFLMIAIAGVMNLRAPQTGPRQIALLLVAPSVVMTGVIAGVTLGGVEDVWNWLVRTGDVVRGFPIAMSLQRQGLVISLGAAASAVIIVAIFLPHRRSRPRWVAIAPLAVPVLWAFRHSFIRNGLAVFEVCLAAAAILMLVAPSRRKMLHGAVAAGTVLALGLAAALAPICACPWSPGGLSPVRGFGNLASALHPGNLRDELDRRSRQELAKDALPSPWVSLIIAAQGGVDTIHSEIAFVPANRLPWNPNPVLQTYQAYTPGLDRLAAEHYRNEGRPSFLLVQFLDIDVRHAMFGAPSMWRAILGHYEPAHPVPATGSYGEVALLRRRTSSVPLELRLIGNTTAPTGPWISVPSRSGLVFASLNFRQNAAGFLAAAAWKVEPVYIDVQRTDGTSFTLRLLPTTARDGLLLAPLPMSASEFLALLRGERPPATVRFRIHGPGLGSYEEGVELTWVQAQWPPRESA